MERFEIYVPKANGQPPENITIADLIPIGRENAVSRDFLVTLCVKYGLVDEHLKPGSKDRLMRRLLEKARMDYTIMNLSNGEGYYRPSHNDLLDLQRYIRQEENREIAIFRHLSHAKALYEDYKQGRINDG